VVVVNNVHGTPIHDACWTTVPKMSNSRRVCWKRRQI